MAARGRLVALEGIDGSGKTTQARAVAEALGARLTHEPGATPIGASLRALLLSPEAPEPSARAEALLMAADRAEHVALVIEPALAAGDWVVSDRYAGSTIAYQGYGRGLEPGELAEVIAWATAGVAADLSVLVDVPVDVAAARLAVARGPAEGPVVPDRIERLGPSFATRVRDGFLAQTEADPQHWIVVDGRQDASALTAHIVAAVQTRFGNAPPTLQ
jgi:dTMP kinase